MGGCSSKPACSHEDDEDPEGVEGDRAASAAARQEQAAQRQARDDHLREGARRGHAEAVQLPRLDHEARRRGRAVSAEANLIETILATRISKLDILEVSGVDGPANLMPGFMVMKSTGEQAAQETLDAI